MSRENVPSYIAREACGCIVGAVMDDPDAPIEHRREMKKELIRWIHDDLIIERVTLGFVCEHFMEKCKEHQNKPEQMMGCPVIADPGIPNDEMRIVDIRNKQAIRIVNLAMGPSVVSQDLQKALNLLDGEEWEQFPEVKR